MNKKHIVTSLGVVLLTTGIIGGIWSGIDAMPAVIEKIQIADEKYNKEEVIYTSQLNLTKLNIDSSISNVVIRKYNGKDIVVERGGNKELNSITVEEKGSELIIKEEHKANRTFGKSIDDIVRYFVDQMYIPHYSEMVVYIPENIDIDVNTQGGTLYVTEDLNLNNVDFNTQYGSISLNKDSKVKNLNIKSNSEMSLQVSEVYATKNINIEANTVYINDDNYVSQGSTPPENVKISVSYGNVSINSKFPIAKNLTIDSKETVELEIPLLDYKFNFDIKTSRGIAFDDYNKERYMGTPLEKYFKYDEDNYEEDSYDSENEEYKQKELIGLINEELNEDATEYKVNVKSAVVILR